MSLAITARASVLRQWPREMHNDGHEQEARKKSNNAICINPVVAGYSALTFPRELSGGIRRGCCCQIDV